MHFCRRHTVRGKGGGSMIGTVLLAFETILTAFVWYRLGRQKAYIDLVNKYKELAKLLGEQGILLDAYKEAFEEKKEKQE